MRLIVKAYEKIESIKNIVGIYDDTFNANCFGDFFLNKAHQQFYLKPDILEMILKEICREN